MGLSRQVSNVHERVLRADVRAIGRLVDDLSSRRDGLWPHDRWPAMRFDGPLAVGATGGHGPIRYGVAAYEPGRAVRFAFTAPVGLCGSHGFDVDGVILRHSLHARLSGRMRLWWPLIYRPLHDALIEDALDRAEASVGSPPVRRSSWNRRVRLLRRLIASRG